MKRIQKLYGFFSSEAVFVLQESDKSNLIFCSLLTIQLIYKKLKKQIQDDSGIKRIF